MSHIDQDVWLRWRRTVPGIKGFRLTFGLVLEAISRATSKASFDCAEKSQGTRVFFIQYFLRKPLGSDFRKYDVCWKRDDFYQVGVPLIKIIGDNYSINN